MLKLLRKYPIWFIEGHGYNLDKLSRIDWWTSSVQLLGSAIMMAIIVKITVFPFQYIYLFCLLIIFAITFIANQIERNTITKADLKLKDDWILLQQKLGTLTYMSQYSITKKAALNYLVETNAAWIKIFEIAKSETRAQQERDQMISNCVLFIRSGLIEKPEDEEDIHFGPIFQKAEPKVSEILNFALTRQTRKEQGLPV